MKRREFITLLGGTAARPLAAKAQQPERVRRIGVLMNIAEDDAQAQSRMEAFLHGLQPLGRTVGRNLQIDVRWAAADAGRNARHETREKDPGPANPESPDGCHPRRRLRGDGD
jgi:putative ABC transport system substrate-binding protein